MKKKNIIYYLNHKNLIGEIEHFGYVFSLKKLMITYLLMICGSLLAAWLFKLHAPEYVLICAAAILITPVLVHHSYRAMYEQRRFSDASRYLEKMLYYFKAHNKIITALENVEQVFHDGNMKNTISQAIEYIHTQDDTLLNKKIKNAFKDTQNERTVEAKALKIIEMAYPNKRIKRMHEFFLMVEQNGGNPNLGIEMQIKEREDWVNDVVKQQKDRTYIRTIFIYFSIIMVGICMFILYIPAIYPVFKFDLSNYALVRIASLLVIIITLALYTKLSNVIGKSWLENDIKDDDAKQESFYYKIINYDFKKERTKSLLYAFVSVVITGILYILTANKMIIIAGGLFSFFLATSYKTGYSMGKKQLAKRMQAAFSDWVMQITLLMQFNNVPVSIAQSYVTAPGILKPEIREMLVALDAEPTSPVPYNNFGKNVNLSSVNEVMNTLYSVQNAFGADVEREIDAIFEQNRKLNESISEQHRKDKKAANEIYLFLEVGAGCVLLIVDLVFMVVCFMSMTVNLI